jgi:hypothetical protein
MPNATVRANARTLPKPKPNPGSAESLKLATIELEDAVEELRLSRFMDLEERLREARHMASIVNLLVREHGTNLPPSRTFELSEEEMNRLLFAAGKVRDMAVDLDDAYHKAWNDARKSEVTQ